MSAAGWRMPMTVGTDLFQLIRLAQYRRTHPGVIIGDLGFGGTWQARWPVPDGEEVHTRHRLEDLMDLLDALESPQAGPSG